MLITFDFYQEMVSSLFRLLSCWDFTFVVSVDGIDRLRLNLVVSQICTI